LYIVRIMARFKGELTEDSCNEVVSCVTQLVNWFCQLREIAKKPCDDKVSDAKKPRFQEGIVQCRQNEKHDCHCELAHVLFCQVRLLGKIVQDGLERRKGEDGRDEELPCLDGLVTDLAAVLDQHVFKLQLVERPTPCAEALEIVEAGDLRNVVFEAVESICRFLEEILCGPDCKHGRCHVKAKLSEDYLKSLLQSKQVEPRRPKEEGVEQPARESEHPTSLILFKRAKSTSDFTKNVSSTFSSTKKSTSFSDEEVKSTGPVLTKTPRSTPTTTKYTPVLTETIKSTPFSTEASTESAPVLTQTTKSTRYWTESTKSTPYWIKSTKSAPVFTESTKSAPTIASSTDSTGASHGRNMGRRKLSNERCDATRKNSEHTSDSEAEAKEDSLHKRLPSFRPPSSFRSAGRRRPVLSLLERKRKSVGPNGLYQYVLWRETYRSVKEKKEKRDESKDLGSRIGALGRQMGNMAVNLGKPF